MDLSGPGIDVKLKEKKEKKIMFVLGGKFSPFSYKTSLKQ
jgi:hypothetical protein